MNKQLVCLDAIYDLNNSVLAFNFVNYLSILQQYAFIKRYEQIDLHLAGKYRKMNHVEKGYGPGYFDFKLQNVYIPLIQMCKFITSYSYNPSGELRLAGDIYPPNYNLSLVKNPIQSPKTLMPISVPTLIDLYKKTKLKPHPFEVYGKLSDYVERTYKKGSNFITITLRNTTHNSGKNISLELMYNLYLKLTSNFPSIKIVVIPDQDDFFLDKQYRAFDWLIDESACVDLALRHSIYSNATLNIITGTGPASILCNSPNNYIIFGLFNSNDRLSTKDNVKASCGIGPGEQFPWGTEFQLADWTDASILSIDHLFNTTKDFLNKILNKIP